MFTYYRPWTGGQCRRPGERPAAGGNLAAVPFPTRDPVGLPLLDWWHQPSACGSAFAHAAGFARGAAATPVARAFSDAAAPMDPDAVRRKVAMLRNKTVANGATPGEARNAAAKADELERRYGPFGPDNGPSGGREGRGSDHGPWVTVTVGQYRALERGGVATLVRGVEPHRYRIDGDHLLRWTAAAGETRHRILRMSMRGRVVVIRYAG